MTSIELTFAEVSDLELLAIGAYAPLDGFVGSRDYEAILTTKRLADGRPWTIPITLAGETKADRVDLTYQGETVGTLDVVESFERDREREAKLVFLTTEEKHPGVARLKASGDTLLAGPVTLLKRVVSKQYGRLSLDPIETRAEFERRGWKRVVGFQTRNPVHRAHEYIQKTALEIVDGLLLHPLVGETKSDDIPADVRLACYEALIEDYYPKNRVVLSTLPAPMRYAGPREAILHALIRKNYGCTHFIVGRDHAGVANYYGPYDAHRIFDEYKPGELGIQPLFFENSFYCTACGAFGTEKTCPHPAGSRLNLSGTEVRARLSRGESLPLEFTRPVVAEILRKAYAR